MVINFGNPPTPTLQKKLSEGEPQLSYEVDKELNEGVSRSSGESSADSLP